jgi:hypothetical protein
MSRTHRALALLALCLALVSVTTAVAAAAPATTAVAEDQSDRLLRNLVAGQAEQSQAAVALARFGERNLPPVAVAEDQSDRALRGLQASQAEQTEAAVALARSVDRNLAPVAAAQPGAVTAPAATGAGVNVLPLLLLSLVGGLVGGGAAIIGWTATSRRRPHRPAAA